MFVSQSCRSSSDHQISQGIHTCKWNATLPPFSWESSICNTHLTHPYGWRQSNLRFKQIEYELEVCKNTTVCPIKSKCPVQLWVMWLFTLGSTFHWFPSASVILVIIFQHYLHINMSLSLSLVDTELLLRFISSNSAVFLLSALILSCSVNIGFITTLPSFL